MSHPASGRDLDQALGRARAELRRLQQQARGVRNAEVSRRLDLLRRHLANDAYVEAEREIRALQGLLGAGFEAGQTLYVPFSDTVDRVTFLEEGDGGRTLKPGWKRGPIAVVRFETGLDKGLKGPVHMTELYADELAAAARSAEMAREDSEEERHLTPPAPPAAKAKIKRRPPPLPKRAPRENPAPREHEVREGSKWWDKDTGYLWMANAVEGPNIHLVPISVPDDAPRLVGEKEFGKRFQFCSSRQAESLEHNPPLRVSRAPRGSDTRMTDSLVVALHRRGYVDVRNPETGEAFRIRKFQSRHEQHGAVPSFYVEQDGRRQSAPRRMDDDELAAWLHHLAPNLVLVRNAGGAMQQNGPHYGFGLVSDKTNKVIETSRSRDYLERRWGLGRDLVEFRKPHAVGDVVMYDSTGREIVGAVRVPRGASHVQPNSRAGRYEVIESKLWRATDGRTASPYGAAPWTNERDRQNWELEVVGWTVRDNERGTVGIGRQPWQTRREAEEWVKSQNERLAGIRGRSGGMRPNSSRRYTEWDDQPYLFPEKNGICFYADEKTNTTVLTDEDGRAFYLTNPLDYEAPDPKKSWKQGSELWGFWFGDISPTIVLWWGDSLEDGLEECAEFMKDHFPGVFVDDDHLKELFDEAKKELIDEGEDPDDEELEGKAQEQATADMTYTESGYIGSDEWGIELQPDSSGKEAEALRSAAAFASDSLRRAAYPDDYDDNLYEVFLGHKWTNAGQLDDLFETYGESISEDEERKIRDLAPGETVELTDVDGATWSVRRGE